jgi:PAS domain S-box-containing protein
MGPPTGIATHMPGDVLVTVLRTVAQPVWLVDPGGLIRFANPAALEVLGYDDLGELLGQPSHETIHHHHPDGAPYPASTCPMLLPRTTGERVERDLDWFFRRDGSMFAVAWVSVPIELEDGRGAVVAFSEVREREAELAEEQAALRRVATLVAGGAPPEKVFAAVAREVSRVLQLPLVEMCRYEPDETAAVIGAIGDHPFQTGTRWPLDGESLTGIVWRTGTTARIDDYATIAGTIGDAARREGVHTGVGAPINVDGRLWGVVSAGASARAPLPPDAEERLSAFTELVAIAIANSQAHEDLQRLADEQAALRRVATLVAQGAESQVVFDAVCAETGRLLDATTVNLAHFTDDAMSVAVAGWSLRDVHVPAGLSLPLAGDTTDALVRESRAPGRIDSYEGAAGALAAKLRDLGIRSEVGAPVVVEGHVWGALIAGTDEPEPLPPGAEDRLAAFAELIATAVSNTTTRTELIASRTRLVQASDERRRRVVRDLHDGAQQHFVHAIMNLQLAHARRGSDARLDELVGDSLASARTGLDELRELARGIHPPILTHHWSR